MTAGGTQLLISPSTPGADLTGPVSPNTFEMRVTNWAYGVQVTAVHVGADEKLVKLPDYPRSIEFIGDSLSAGMYATYEALSAFAYGVGAGLGDTEYNVVAYSGICVADQNCWGNPRGQVHQWWYASDGSWRQDEIWGTSGGNSTDGKGGPEPWDFSAHRPADIVVINLGTNDANSANNVSATTYVSDYKRLVQGIHGVYPRAQVVLMSMWQGFYKSGNRFAQNRDLQREVYEVYQYFNSEEYLKSPTTWNGITNKTTVGTARAEPFVHFFNTTGILQHNDIAPQWHPTDVGHIKVASHLIQYIRIKFGWDLYATGPE